MQIQGHKEEYENLRKKFGEILLLFSFKDVQKTSSHDNGWIVADDDKNILYPFIDAFSDSRFNGFVVKFDRSGIGGKKEFPVCSFFRVFHIVVPDDMGCFLVDQRKSPYDDMGWNSGIEEGKDVGDDRIVSS